MPNKKSHLKILLNQTTINITVLGGALLMALTIGNPAYWAAFAITASGFALQLLLFHLKITELDHEIDRVKNAYRAIGYAKMEDVKITTAPGGDINFPSVQEIANNIKFTPYVPHAEHAHRWIERLCDQESRAKCSICGATKTEADSSRLY